MAEDEAAETAAARALAVDGLKLADSGKCSEAIEKLARAEKLHHAPIVLGRLGECQILQGKLVDGTENLRKVLREATPANPSPALTKARDRAQVALDSAKPKIAVLTIVVKGAPVGSVSVTVDGQSVSSALLDTERPTDPGEHIIEATAQGFLKASSKLNLTAGEKQSVTLKLESDPNFVPPATPEAAGSSARTGTTVDAGAATSTRDTGSGSFVPSPPNRSAAYISWAFGGAAVAVGAGFGLVAIKDKNDLEKQCLQNQCAPNLDGQLNSAKTVGTISTISFAIGGAGLVLGTVLYLTAGPGSGERSAHARAAAVLPSFVAPRAYLGVNHVGFAADF